MIQNQCFCACPVLVPSILACHLSHPDVWGSKLSKGGNAMRIEASQYRGKSGLQRTNQKGPLGGLVGDWRVLSHNQVSRAQIHDNRCRLVGTRGRKHRELASSFSTAEGAPSQVCLCVARSQKSRSSSSSSSNLPNLPLDTYYDYCSTRSVGRSRPSGAAEGTIRDANSGDFSIIEILGWRNSYNIKS